MNGNWTIRIDRLPIDLAVGVHAHEQSPQAVRVSLVIKGRAAARPAELGECLDYAPLLHWLTREWPATPHVPLLETRLNELFARAFALDARIDSVWAGLYKQLLGGATATVGMERGVSRREFAQQGREAVRPTARLQTMNTLRTEPLMPRRRA